MNELTYLKKQLYILMHEHKEAGYCTSLELAEASNTDLLNVEDIQDRFYDAGYYEALQMIFGIANRLSRGELND